MIRVSTVAFIHFFKAFLLKLTFMYICWDLPPLIKDTVVKVKVKSETFTFFHGVVVCLCHNLSCRLPKNICHGVATFLKRNQPLWIPRFRQTWVDSLQFSGDEPSTQSTRTVNEQVYLKKLLGMTYYWKNNCEFSKLTMSLRLSI